MITKIKELKQLIRESLTLPKLRIAKNVEYKDYKNVTLDDMEIVEIGDDGHSIIHLGFKIYGELEEGLVLDIQLINDELYHPHMNIAPNLRKQGLSNKMLEKFIYEFGNIYATKNRTLNQEEIVSVLKRLGSNPNLIHAKTGTGDDLYVLKDNPNAEYLLDKYSIYEPEMA